MRANQAKMGNKPTIFKEAALIAQLNGKCWLRSQLWELLWLPHLSLIKY